MTRTPFWIALFVAILATACGGAGTNTSGDPRVDAALNNPETAVAPDVPSPPPDVPVITADADSPTDAATPVDAAVATDVPAPSDVPVATDTATPPPPDSGMMAIIERLNSHEWHTTGNDGRGAIDGQFIDGQFQIVISTSIRVDTGARYDYGACDPVTRECTLPETVASDGCLWTGLSSTMVTFHSNCHGRETNIEIGRAR